jgi:hypothetical protein
MSDTARGATPADAIPGLPEFSRAPSGGIVVLDLDKLRRGSSVTLSGVECRLRSPRSLTPLESRRLVRYSLRIDALIQQPEISADEEKELAGLPDTMCRIVLDAPAKVHKGLDDETRMVLIAEFLNGQASRLG